MKKHYLLAVIINGDTKNIIIDKDPIEYYIDKISTIRGEETFYLIDFFEISGSEYSRLYDECLGGCQ